MGILRQLFGPSKEEIWRQFAAQTSGAAYVDGGLWKGDKVEARTGPWTVTLDTYTVSTGKTHTTYTRLRAPYVNPDNFRFSVYRYRANFFSPLAKALGMQDIPIGEPAFDDTFIVKANNESKVRALLENVTIRSYLTADTQARLDVKDDEGWFGASFPAGVDELSCVMLGVVKDVERLRGLYELFAETLAHLTRIGSAYDTDPGVRL